MTVREAKLIQTFPPDFKISGKWGEALRQIGNAVPVKLAEIIGKRLFSLLSAAEQHHSFWPYRTGTDGAYLLFDQPIRYSVCEQVQQRNTSPDSENRQKMKRQHQI